MILAKEIVIKPIKLKLLLSSHHIYFVKRGKNSPCTPPPFFMSVENQFFPHIR